jgi:hypothetical protein
MLASLIKDVCSRTSFFIVMHDDDAVQPPANRQQASLNIPSSTLEYARLHLMQVVTALQHQPTGSGMLAPVTRLSNCPL